MNELIQLLALQIYGSQTTEQEIKFAQLVVEAVLDQVAERAYCTGDRVWSDELDRKWIQLEFGYGELAEIEQ